MSTKKLIFNTDQIVNGILTLNAGRSTINVTNLSNTEIVSVQIPKVQAPDVDVDSDWENLYLDGALVEFTYNSQNSFLLIGPNVYRLKKTATSLPVLAIAFGEYIE